jgi:hypothetical protein
MKKTAVAIGLVAAILVPSAAAAETKPDKGDTRAAVAQCKSERGKTKATREAFRSKYKSMSRCVRQKAEERKNVRTNAANGCKAERDEIGAKAFAEKYDTNRNGRNAFGVRVNGGRRGIGDTPS